MLCYEQELWNNVRGSHTIIPRQNADSNSQSTNRLQQPLQLLNVKLQRQMEAYNIWGPNSDSSFKRVCAFLKTILIVLARFSLGRHITKYNASWNLGYYVVIAVFFGVDEPAQSLRRFFLSFFVGFHA